MAIANLLIVFTALAQVADADPAASSAPIGKGMTSTTDRILFALEEFLEKQGVEVLEAEVVKYKSDDGDPLEKVLLYGIRSPDVSEQDFTAKAKDELKKKVGVIGWPQLTQPREVDVSKMLVFDTSSMSDMRRLLLVERILDDMLSEVVERTTRANVTVDVIRLRGKVRILHYNVKDRRMTLCGVVSNGRERQRIEQMLLRLKDVEDVVSDHVLLTDARSLSADTADSYLDTRPLHCEAMSALKHSSGPELVCFADEMIRMGRFSSSVWYLRAAGHLMSGNDILAVGDLRIAGADRDRHGLLEKFQGHQRIKLERMVAHGPFITFTSPQIPCSSGLCRNSRHASN